MKFYGNITNRLEEGRQFVDEIKVGDGVTEYSWSDRDAYEIIAVKDQKHFTMRKLDAIHVGEAFENKWELKSNENNPEYEIAKRGKAWYYVITFTADMIPEQQYDENGNYTDKYLNAILGLAYNNSSIEELREKGKITRYRKANISIGKADYYYDYEF